MNKGETCALPRLISAFILVAALASPLVDACIDDHEAEQCTWRLDCPPDAGTDGDAGIAANLDASDDGSH